MTTIKTLSPVTLGKTSSSKKELLTLDGITLNYSSATAVERVSGVFKRGSMTAIVGPNGGGKSTLLKGIMGIHPLRSGSITKHGVSADNFAFLPQQSKVDRTFPLTVFDVVAMGLSKKSGFFSRIRNKEKIHQALETVGLESFASRSIEALSGGQFQKVLFARLWLQDTDVILLDEPFSGIDRHTTEDLVQLLKTWNKSGKTIISVLHHYDLVRSHFPETLIIARRLIDWGKTSETLTRENLDKAIEQSRYWDSCFQTPSVQDSTIFTPNT